MLFRATDENTAGSAAGRTALESVVFAPGAVTPERGVEWRAEADNHLVARFDLPPERPEVDVRIDADGAVRSVCALRWGNAGQDEFGYIPCGGEIGRDGEISVGWWWGTPRYAPFFRASVV